MTESAAPLIAVVEDEDHLAQGLLFNLQAEGYRTHHESDGDAALAYFLTADQRPEEDIAAIILDCMLPGADGFTIVRALREAQRYTPVLMLTARSRPDEVLEGIEAGADDYLAKPFDLNILLVRLKSLLRRTAWQTASTNASAQQPSQETRSSHIPEAKDEYAFNHRTIRFDTLELIAPNRITHLTLMEADLLRYLTDREGQIVSRKQILEEVWRVHEDTDTRAIDNFIVRLRRYIEDDPADPQHLVTVRGIGYRFLANP
jgi:DNA-binding response OmpR family regulator